MATSDVPGGKPSGRGNRSQEGQRGYGTQGGQSGRGGRAAQGGRGRARGEAAAQALVARVRNDVWRLHPGSGREARARDRILVAMGRLPQPFDQQADPTHITGSALILGPRGVLLHRHKRLKMWLQPGGHLEARETPWQAALREAGEETGLQLEWAEVAADGLPGARSRRRARWRAGPYPPGSSLPPGCRRIGRAGAPGGGEPGGPLVRLGRGAGHRRSGADRLPDAVPG